MTIRAARRLRTMPGSELILLIRHHWLSLPAREEGQAVTQDQTKDKTLTDIMICLETGRIKDMP